MLSLFLLLRLHSRVLLALALAPFSWCFSCDFRAIPPDGQTARQQVMREVGILFVLLVASFAALAEDRIVFARLLGAVFLCSPSRRFSLHLFILWPTSGLSPLLFPCFRASLYSSLPTLFPTDSTNIWHASSESKLVIDKKEN